MIVLALNSGSSSLKFGLYETEGSAVRVLIGGEATDGMLCASDASGSVLQKIPLANNKPSDAAGAIEKLLTDGTLSAPEAIGHRVVHGGPMLREHCLIDDNALRKLREASSMSPLHGPETLAMIEAAGGAFPGLPQVACLDTAFHASLLEVVRTFPIPRALRAEGIQRYGFHGLSCESIVRQLGHDLPARLIVAHLGSGASVTAIRDGQSVDTSMGLTPSGGVVMATRSGELDPGILIYLLREKGYDAATLEQLVDHQSGLLGISGVSGDMRRLHADASSNPDARLAIAMFCLSVAKQIAAMMVSLGGLDMLVFTGGVGERDSGARAEICGHLVCLGIELARGEARTADENLASPQSRCDVRVLASEENTQIARHVYELVSGSRAT